MPREFPFEAENAPREELSELAAKVRAKGRRTERALDRLCRADEDLYAAVRGHILDSCDLYTVVLWQEYLDDNALRLARLKDDAAVAEEVRLELAAIEVVVELRPEPLTQSAPNGTVFHHAVRDLMSLYRWSMRSASGKPVSAEVRRATVLAVWLRWRPEAGHAVDTEVVVNLRANREDLAFLTEHFEAAMAHRDALREHRTIDRAVVAAVIDSSVPVLDAGIL